MIPILIHTHILHHINITYDRILIQQSLASSLPLKRGGGAKVRSFVNQPSTRLDQESSDIYIYVYCYAKMLKICEVSKSKIAVNSGQRKTKLSKMKLKI